MPSSTGGHSLPSVPKLSERSTALCRLPADPCRIGSDCDLAAPPALPGAAHGTCPGCRAGWPLRPVWARQSEQSECQAAQPSAGGQPWPPVQRRSWKAPQPMRPGRTGPCAFGWLETESMPRRKSHHQFKRDVTPATSPGRRRHEPGTAPPPYRHQLAMVSAAPARTGRCSLPRPRVMCNKRLGLLTRAVCQTPRGTSTAARPSKERVCRPSGSSSSS